MEVRVLADIDTPYRSLAGQLSRAMGPLLTGCTNVDNGVEMHLGYKPSDAVLTDMKAYCKLALPGHTVTFVTGPFRLRLTKKKCK